MMLPVSRRGMPYSTSTPFNSETKLQTGCVRKWRCTDSGHDDGAMNVSRRDSGCRRPECRHKFSSISCSCRQIKVIAPMTNAGAPDRSLSARESVAQSCQSLTVTSQLLECVTRCGLWPKRPPTLRSTVRTVVSSDSVSPRVVHTPSLPASQPSCTLTVLLEEAVSFSAATSTSIRGGR